MSGCCLCYRHFVFYTSLLLLIFFVCKWFFKDINHLQTYKHSDMTGNENWNEYSLEYIWFVYFSKGCTCRQNNISFFSTVAMFLKCIFHFIHNPLTSRAKYIRKMKIQLYKRFSQLGRKLFLEWHSFFIT